MKKYYSNLLLITIIILLQSCSSTNQLTLTVTEPAPVYINKNITKIGIINRSIPDKKYEAFDAIDKILTLEGKELDKKGGIAAIENLKDELLKNNRIQSVVVIDSVDFKKYGIDQFSAELTWAKIDEICNKHNIEALYELSFYDTDSNINYKTITSQVNNNFGIKIPIIEHEATVNTLIKSGWRIYDNKDKVISDYYTTAKTVTLSGRGINPLKAFETILGRKDAVINVSKNMGYEYALRILPYNHRVSRDYYVKGTNNFAIGQRRAQAGKWDNAAELWLLETNNHDPKIAGRACYNMAIINEINGDLDKAIEWATKSYTDYNDKIALRYLNVLKNRKAKTNQLEQETN
ncbi:DUF6340 family protein [Flavobacterium urocaniciphilum]|uniref:Tetratricopeptide repeat-containing protein n=1 Tax=Flavobacterium urocaniciphilum TaxID=1299341 RepID=A0A1H9ATK8_9FLAO|nr:DUF6340 family protein [Flavobacterium urocaniciphilum]SEP80050.1 hypothetical protein SAMN05444005_102332 [Flavobacterium urocaniciphilum]